LELHLLMHVVNNVNECLIKRFAVSGAVVRFRRLAPKYNFRIDKKLSVGS
jgi:hypothetical protein